MSYKKLFALVCSFVLVTGCSSNSSDAVKIGVNLELSGAVASYGEAELSGIELAIEQANAAGGVLGKQIELVKLDNKSTADEALSVFTKLATQDLVSVVIGPATSGATKATVPAANQYKVPVVTPSGTADDVTNDGTSAQAYAFRTCFKDSFQGVTLANFSYQNLGARRAVILGDSSSDYAKGLSENFETKFTADGGTIVLKESYVAGDKDFNAVLTRIKASIGEDDVLFIPGYYEEAGLIIKQAREMGITTPIVGADGFDSPVLNELATDANLNDVYFSGHYSSLDEDENVVSFIADYKAKYGTEPNAFAALGYDAAKLAIDAINRAGTTTPETVKEALEQTVGFVGVTGTITVDSLHDAVKSAVVIELQNGVQTSSVKVNP
ncbi:MAG: ABC transporter substrate-binding protein [Erysipelotrichaceae bacterium]